MMIRRGENGWVYRFGHIEGIEMRFSKRGGTISAATSGMKGSARTLRSTTLGF
jgi:hypothetical protein